MTMVANPQVMVAVNETFEKAGVAAEESVRQELAEEALQRADDEKGARADNRVQRAINALVRSIEGSASEEEDAPRPARRGTTARATKARAGAGRAAAGAATRAGDTPGAAAGRTRSGAGAGAGAAAGATAQSPRPNNRPAYYNPAADANRPQQLKAAAAGADGSAPAATRSVQHGGDSSTAAASVGSKRRREREGSKTATIDAADCEYKGQVVSTQQARMQPLCCQHMYACAAAQIICQGNLWGCSLTPNAPAADRSAISDVPSTGRISFGGQSLAGFRVTLQMAGWRSKETAFRFTM